MPTLTRGYTYRLHPTSEQAHLFVQWAGCRRLVWNHFLERRQQHYRQTGQTLSYAALCRELTVLKQQPEFAFLNECDSQALQQGLKDLCTAYTRFFEKHARFPKRKSK